MEERYDFRTIEVKWQARWEAEQTFRAPDESPLPKYYTLEMFPYPSGSGLHVGHCKNYAPSDAFCRHKSMCGFNVLHPMGWDAFGQPAENEAIKRGRNPREMVPEYAANYKRTLKMLGCSYDWSREVNSSEPEYYRWTQWLFLLLYRRGLAYRATAPINWCPSCKTGLANEEVQEGRCWRCGSTVEKRPMPQWFFRITAYADRLLQDLEGINWSDGLKEMQRDWIGRSEGALVEFEVRAPDPLTHARGGRMGGDVTDSPLSPAAGEEPGVRAYAGEGPLGGDATGSPLSPAAGEGPEAWAAAGLGASPGPAPLDPELSTLDTITVFTTRPDTLWGATFMVLAPEHPLVERLTAPEQRDDVSAYVRRAQATSEMDRLNAERVKTGVFLGSHAINPVNGAPIPIWIADYVLMGYGTGAIMAVPAHDQRDFEFARKYDLAVDLVYAAEGGTASGEEMTEAIPSGGVMRTFAPGPGARVDGFPFAGKPNSKETVREVTAWLESQGVGRETVNFRLRDWLISRQRYWGAPIPIVHCEKCGEAPVPDDQLPVLLPDVENYQPSGTGESPLANIPAFVNTICPVCGGPARRETDTMGGYACSSWYFMRFADPRNDREFAGRDRLGYWLPVDTYAGGVEHARSHLLYSRFWTKALADAGIVDFTEPFLTLRNQGSLLSITLGRRPRSGEQNQDDEPDETVQDWIILTPEERARFPQDHPLWARVREWANARDKAAIEAEIEREVGVIPRWARMSKSKGNVVTPDEMAEAYGADTLRLYVMFVAPFEDNVQWSTEGVQGSFRFVNRVWRWFAAAQPVYRSDWRDNLASADLTPAARSARRKLHQTIRRVGENINDFRFNTAIAALMELVNELYAWRPLDGPAAVEGEPFGDPAVSEALECLTLMLAPFTPHLADELWERMGQPGSTYRARWPSYDETAAAEDEITIIVQVNGKVRDRLVVAASIAEQEIEQLALAAPGAASALDGKEIRKIIIVPRKLINIVAG